MVFAATYAITVKTGKVRALPKTLICQDNNRPCFLTLNLAENETRPVDLNDYIEISVLIAEKQVHLQFMQSNRYLRLVGSHSTSLQMALDKNGDATAIVDLLDPDSLEKDQLVIHPVLQTGTRVATLGVVIQPELRKH